MALTNKIRLTSHSHSPQIINMINFLPMLRAEKPCPRVVWGKVGASAHREGWSV